MKNFASTLALAITALSCSSAHAALGANLTYLDIGSPDPAYVGTFHAQSQSASETVLVLDTLQGFGISGFSSGDGITVRNEQIELYGIKATDGYQVTGITLEFTMSGTVSPVAYNFGGFTLATQGSEWYREGFNVTDAASYAVSVTGLSAQQAFDLRLTAAIGAWVQADVDEQNNYTTPGSASIRMDSVKLIVSTAQVAAPVPEPGTWLMLGTGLALVGAVARRRQRQ